MDILKTLKEEQKEYQLTLLEDIQDSSGASIAISPNKSSPSASTLFPTSYPRDKKKIILKRIPTTSMEDFLMKLQLLQNMQAKQEAEQQAQQDQQSQEQQTNESFLFDVLHLLNEKKVFNMFGPKTLNSLAALSVAGGIGLGGKAFEKSIDSKDNTTSSKVSLSKAPEKQTLKINDLKKSIEKPVETKEENPTDVVRDMLVPQLKQSEGWRSRVYKDHKGNATVGHGALVDSSFRGTMKQVFPKQSDEWINKVATGNTELTASQGHDLLSHQAKQKFGETRKMIGDKLFDTMHPELQTALSDAHFRGSLRGSPKTLALIRAGDLSGASKEFLDNDEYRQSVKDKTGVHKRMENISKTLAKHHGSVIIDKPETKQNKK
jgi:GH24 family phage-related lysozyme (muramidase)